MGFLCPLGIGLLKKWNMCNIEIYSKGHTKLFDTFSGKKFLYLPKLWPWLSSHLQNYRYHFSQICGIIGHSFSYLDVIMGHISSNRAELWVQILNENGTTPVQN